MKKVFLLAILATVSISLFSQERISRKKLSFDYKSEILSDATGWEYSSSSGDWIKHKNMATVWELAQDGSEFHMSKTPQNFISMQIKSFKNDTTRYYVLIVERWSGSYRYPSISQDWNTHKLYEAYIFDTVQYEKMKKAEDDIVFKNRVKYDPSFRGYNDSLLLDDIQNEMFYRKKYSFEENTAYIFKLKKATDGSIRFTKPFSNQKYNSDYDSVEDFDKQYFETTPQNFSNLFVKYNPPAQQIKRSTPQKSMVKN